MESKRSRFRTFLYRMAHYLSVCRCIACGDVIGGDEVFCEECAEEYRAAMLSECGMCGRSLRSCLCADSAFDGSIVHKHIKLYRYQTDDPEAVGNRILYRFKKNDISTCFRFFGDELATTAEKLLPIDGEYVVTFLPRTPNRVLEYGFDQSKRIARETGDALGLKMISTLKRSMRAKPQKGIATATARKKNTESSLFIRKDVSKKLVGKRVLLVDDVVTSGASMRTAAKLLRDAGAKEIIAVSVAVVTRTRNLALEAKENSRLPFYMR
ncbi:MAG: ComF family protein [Ruminococcaceae bacterium]|nr:ComF family protein [Oscillospiraceae bacterium]